MTTRLDRPLRREVLIERRPHTVVLSPDGLRLVERGRRKGIELGWKDLVSGEAALAAALQASVASIPRRADTGKPARKTAARRR
jgi:hypothetical protein